MCVCVCVCFFSDEYFMANRFISGMQKKRLLLHETTKSSFTTYPTFSRVYFNFNAAHLLALFFILVHSSSRVHDCSRNADISTNENF